MTQVNPAFGAGSVDVSKLTLWGNMVELKPTWPNNAQTTEGPASIEKRPGLSTCATTLEDQGSPRDGIEEALDLREWWEQVEFAHGLGDWRGDALAAACTDHHETVTIK